MYSVRISEHHVNIRKYCQKEVYHAQNSVRNVVIYIIYLSAEKTKKLFHKMAIEAILD